MRKHKLDPVTITGMRPSPMHYTVILHWTDAELVNFGGPLEMYSHALELCGCEEIIDSAEECLVMDKVRLQCWQPAVVLTPCNLNTTPTKFSQNFEQRRFTGG